MKKTRFVKSFGMLLAYLVLFGMSVNFAAAAPAADSPKSGGTLVIGTDLALRHFNGAAQSGVATALGGTQIFASPLRFDENWNPQPYLAEKWEVAPDGLSVTLHLVKNAVFHDGRPVTSADVAFSVMTIKKNHPFQPMLDPVTGVDTPDAHTAILRMSQPHPAIILAMSPALMPILPKHVYDTGEDIKSHPANLKPIGSGPYRLTEFKPGEYYILEKFDKFFIPGRPYLDKIVVRIIQDNNNMLLSLEKGDIQFVAMLTDTRSLERLSKTKGFVVTNKGYAGLGSLCWVAFNTQKKPFDDARVRKAVSYVIDRNFIISKLLAGFVERNYGPLASASPFAAKGLEKYDVNYELANKLLDEAGYKKNAKGERFEIQIDYEPTSTQRKVAEYLRPQLKKIGIVANLRSSPDFPSWSQRIANYDFDLTTDMVSNWSDPVIGVARTYLTSNIRKGIIWTNTQRYSNPKVDDLLNKAAVEMDRAKRIALYNEFEKIVVDEAPIAYICTTPHHSAFRDTLANPPLTVWGPFSPMDELYWKTQP